LNLFFVIGILNWIFSNPGSTLKSATKQLDIPKNTVCVSIDGLVSLGLVERKQSTEKRREVHLKVTTRGKDVSQRLIKNTSSYKAMAKALENLSKKRNIKFSSKLSKNIILTGLFLSSFSVVYVLFLLTKLLNISNFIVYKDFITFYVILKFMIFIGDGFGLRGFLFNY